MPYLRIKNIAAQNNTVRRRWSKSLTNLSSQIHKMSKQLKGGNKFATKSQTRIRFTSSGVFSVLPGKSYQWWKKSMVVGLILVLWAWTHNPPQPNHQPFDHLNPSWPDVPMCTVARYLPNESPQSDHACLRLCLDTSNLCCGWSRGLTSSPTGTSTAASSISSPNLLGKNAKRNVNELAPPAANSVKKNLGQLAAPTPLRPGLGKKCFRRSCFL